MGYRDQNGNVHGPFALDHGFILYEWEERDGEPGSPLNDDYAGLAVGRDAQGATLYEQVQSFEHGSIVYDTSSFQPLLMRDNKTWHAGVSFQDTASNDQDVTALYYPLDSGTSCGSNLIGMATNGVVIRNPLPPSGQCGWSPTTFVGSGWAMRGSDFAAVVNQATTANLNTMSYSAVRQGATTVVVPLLLKNHDGWWGRNDWYAGLAVQNLGSSQATVNIVYYNADGTQRGAEPARQVPAKATRVYNPAPTNAGITSFQGSAVVTANQPIAVVVNLITAGSTDDTGMSYTGLNH